MFSTIWSKERDCYAPSQALTLRGALTRDQIGFPADLSNPRGVEAPIRFRVDSVMTTSVPLLAHLAVAMCSYAICFSMRLSTLPERATTVALSSSLLNQTFVTFWRDAICT